MLITRVGLAIARLKNMIAPARLNGGVRGGGGKVLRQDNAREGEGDCFASLIPELIRIYTRAFSPGRLCARNDRASAVAGNPRGRKNID